MDKNLRLFNLNCKTKLPHKYLVNMVLGDHLLWLLGFVGRDPSPFKTTQIKNSDKLGAKKKRKSANVFTLILNLGGKQWIWILMWEVCDRRGSVHYRTFYSSNRGKRRKCLAFSISALKNFDLITEVKYFYAWIWERHYTNQFKMCCLLYFSDWLHHSITHNNADVCTRIPEIMGRAYIVLNRQVLTNKC